MWVVGTVSFVNPPAGQNCVVTPDNFVFTIP